ncbi:MAG: hypothetical protein IV112_11785 [Methyloversatilis discipulorum]|uniref:hypothetical protein n=1 Tax=Methyloversatilis discipulorum TaxID=1119528 RepID=UPI0026EB7652|nr:hypothetical protein [Methyloversatilis discipulorum]MBT9517365.1 hypothetical protein [Methyloversatilis discipulorum]
MTRLAIASVISAVVAQPEGRVTLSTAPPALTASASHTARSSPLKEPVFVTSIVLSSGLVLYDESHIDNALGVLKGSGVKISLMYEQGRSGAT